MALFQVELRNDKDPNRSKFKSVESGSEEAALANTSLPGWTARKAVPVSKADESKHAKKKARRFPDAEMDNFLETCAGMLEAEMSLPETLKIYASDHPNKTVKGQILKIVSQLEGGTAAHEAFRESGCFDQVFIGLLKAGKDAGDQSFAFNSMSNLVRTRIEAKGDIVGSITEPLIAAVMASVIIIVVMFVLLPQIEKMSDESGMPAPAFSVMLFSISHFLRAFWTPIVLGAIGFAMACTLRPQLRKGIMVFLTKHWRGLRLMVWSYWQMIFVGTFRLLLEADVPRAKGLSTCAMMFNGSIFGDQLDQVQKLVESRNESLAKSLAKATDCDETLIHMVRIGEEKGVLDKQLALLDRLYVRKSRSTIKRFGKRLYATTMTVSTVLIVVIYLGAQLPILGLAKQIVSAEL